MCCDVHKFVLDWKIPTSIFLYSLNQIFSTLLAEATVEIRLCGWIYIRMAIWRTTVMGILTHCQTHATLPEEEIMNIDIYNPQYMANMWMYCEAWETLNSFRITKLTTSFCQPLNPYWLCLLGHTASILMIHKHYEALRLATQNQ